MAPLSLEGLSQTFVRHLSWAMTPATSENEKVRFHTLDARTGNRVVSQYIDAVSEKPVDEDGEVKGYPRGEDDL